MGGRSPEGYYVGRTSQKPLNFVNFCIRTLSMGSTFYVGREEKIKTVPRWAGISRAGSRDLPRCRTQAGGISEAGHGRVLEGIGVD